MSASWILLAFTSIKLLPSTGGDQSSTSCIHNCVNRFTATADKIMGPSYKTPGSWHNLLQSSNDGNRMRNERTMRKNFDDMCRSFSSMKRCVQQCGNAWLQDSVVSGFASIQYVCEDRYEDFITHLPCLAANERLVVERCSLETNRTAAAISALEKALKENDFAKMPPILAALCSNTSQIVNCLKPATEELCGKQPADILRRLVTLGFQSIKEMYKKMNLADHLPSECASLADRQSDEVEDRPNMIRPHVASSSSAKPRFELGAKKGRVLVPNYKSTSSSNDRDSGAAFGHSLTYSFLYLLVPSMLVSHLLK